MPTKMLSRRKVLRGALHGTALTVALPRLEAMLNGNGTALAAGAPLPRRFGTWAIANGVHLQRWNPAQTGAGYTLSEQLKPLEPVKDWFTVVSGTNLPAVGASPGRGHAAANTILMTGVGMQGGGENFTAAGKSIDQMVAEALPQASRKSIEVGVSTGPGHEPGTAFHWWSHNGPNSPNICNYNCKEVFDLLFAGAKPGTGAPAGTAPAPAANLTDHTMKARTSVLDYVKADADDLMKVLGSSDKQRLQQHLEGIFSIEKRIQSANLSAQAAAGAGGCTKPPAPMALVGSSADYDANVKLIHKTMAQLVATALACDITRVFTFQVMQPGCRTNVRTITGQSAGYHGLSHGNPADASCHKVVLAMMDELRVFIEIFRDTKDGAGSLLDNCAILASNDCNQGPSHGLTDYPMIVIGKAGGLKMGLHIRASGDNGLKVPLTLARAAGANLPGFGNGGTRATDNLTGLVG